ncbi:MAG: gfo/Idh/MocA family oxidoreductase [Chloroflexi bacterium]|nr:MAG: gfo/Idh/MocA family oxidoreductase [Chloroflexota bacterium]MBL1196470.1 gfo/Idh/MocA family oxidoreductase [Chloroflexota bacterium]NOH13765.1 Gfo/Idh/MocA family oxidoreductase [Chloroflexota bacterium]
MTDYEGYTQVDGLEAPEVGVGMLGYAFMGRAHSNAMLKLPSMMYPPKAIPKLVAVCGRNQEAVAEMASRFGYAGYYTDWEKMLADERIKLVDNGGPNDVHEEPCVAAAEAGINILCEKPLARTTEEAKRMWDAVKNNKVKGMVAFNYRFAPAVRQARDLIASGALGKIYHFRAMYLQDWILPHFNTPYLWRHNKEVSGTGAIGDFSHIIDIGHFLLGSRTQSVQSTMKTFIPERELMDGSGTGVVDVDDAFASVIEFENGAIGTLEGTRLASGRKNYHVFEVNGEKGSIAWNLERLNELEVHWAEDEPAETRGFRNVMVTEGDHPWIENWWPPGHTIGWEHTFVHEVDHLLDCIVNDKEVGPEGATFEDGYNACVVADAIVESSETGRRVDCKY